MSKKYIKILINEIEDSQKTLNKMFSKYRSNCKHKEIYFMGSIKCYGCDIEEGISDECHWSYCPKLKDK